MSRYLIEMKPLNTFFFGQENKYRKRKGKKDPEADYFQRSAYFPQQTTLLGALRYCILQMNGQIPISDSIAASKLIGNTSFQVTKEQLKFGAIGNLSPVFILKNDGKSYFQNPKDLILNNPEGKDEKKTIYLQKSTANEKSEKSEFIYLQNDKEKGEFTYFPNYKEKDGLDTFLINNENDFLPLDYDKKEAGNGVFLKHEKIGITKKKDGESDEEAFYKQISFSLKNEFCFALIADIEESALKQKQIITSMGAEKSPFQFTFHKLCDTEEDSFNWIKALSDNKKTENVLKLESENTPKLFLLSDAYIPKYSTDDFQFAISDTKSFRFIQSVVETGNKYYSSNPLAKQELKRSCKYKLLERGSVFFFKDEDQMEAFSQKLKSEQNFYSIGYNHFLTIK